MFERTAMQKIKERLAQTIDFIKGKLKQAPYIGLLTGTGLSESAGINGNRHGNPL